MGDTPAAYVVLFRGINVGGAKSVRMEALRSALLDAGFSDVASYIQSGNIVLRSRLGKDDVRALVERTFMACFGFDSNSMVLTAGDWQDIIRANPFAAAAADGKSLHAIILDEQPPSAALDTLRSLASTEQIALTGKTLYLYTPDGFGRSPVAAKLDRVVNVPLTARNWNTVLKLQEMVARLG